MARGGKKKKGSANPLKMVGGRAGKTNLLNASKQKPLSGLNMSPEISGLIASSQKDPWIPRGLKGSNRAIKGGQ